MAIRILPASLLGLACAVLGSGCSAPRAVAPDLAPGARVVSATGALRPLDATPFERLWDLRLPAPVHASWQSPAIPGLLVLQLTTRELVGISAMSGDTRWISPPLPELVSLPPHLVRVRRPARQANEFIDDDRMYVVSQDTLLCLDLGSGQTIWRWDLPFAASTGPCAVGSDGDLRVFLGDWRGYLRVASLHAAKRFPYLAWQWNLGAGVIGQPVDYQGQVYVGDLAGRLHAFHLDRDQAWEATAGAPVPGPLTVHDRLLFAGTADHVLAVLNRLTGETLGQITLPGPVSRPLLAFDDAPERVFAWIDPVPGRAGGLAALHARYDTVPWSGDAKRQPREVARLGLEWFMPDAAALVTSTPGKLYLTCAGAPHRLVAVDRASGAVDWTAELQVESTAAGGGLETGRPAVVIGGEDPHDLQRTLLVADAAGRLSCRRFFGVVPAAAASASAAAR